MVAIRTSTRGRVFPCPTLACWLTAAFVLLWGTAAALCQDCNGNGIPDACDISCGEPGGACDVPGCGLSADCNRNGVPDECDIALTALPADRLTLWLRADAGVTVDSDAIVTWADQSGLGNDYGPAMGHGAPALVLDVLNYNPVVRFDGVDDRLTNGGQLITGTRFTIITVLSLIGGDYVWEVGGETPYRVFYERGADSGDPSHIGNTLYLGCDNGNDVRATYPGISSPGFRTLSIVADQTLSGTQVFVNGHAADMQLTGEDRSWVLGSGQNNLGWTAHPFFGRAEVAEYIVYDRLLSDAERRYVERYLGAKYFDTIGANDCDGNGVPDECEWVDCNANGVFDGCDLADGSSADCNGNGVPDECDIASGASEDCIDAEGQPGFPNGVPDECDLQLLSLIYSRSNPSPVVQAWNSEATWCPALVPDNNGEHTFDVTLTGGPVAPIVLDISPTITRLTIENGAALEVNELSGASMRTLAADNPVNNDGCVRALDGKRLVLDAPQLLQTAAGQLEARGGSCMQINGSHVVGGNASARDEGSRIELLGGTVLEDVTIQGELDRAGLFETIRVPPGQYAQIAGTIRNASLVGVGTGATPGPAFLFADVFGATLSGDGCLRLGSPDSFLFVSGTTLINGPEHTIAGSGWIFGAPTNLGTIVADQAGEVLSLRSGALTINDGVLAAADGGVLQIENPVSGAGGLEAYAGGAIVIGDDAQIALAGVVTIRDGGRLGRVGGVADVTLQAGSLAVLDSVASGPGTLITLDERMVATVSGPVLIDGVEICPLRGCTPPILHMDGTAQLLAQTVEVLAGGELQLGGHAGVQVAGALTLDRGGVIRGVGPSEASLTADSLTLASTAYAGGRLLLDEDIRLHVMGDLVIDQLGPGLDRGCTPPILHARGDARVTIDGAFVENSGANVEVTTLNFEVGADFDIGSSDAGAFHWESGGLMLTTDDVAHLEAAGTDLGSGAAGWIYNFAFGRLELSGSGIVEVRDFRDNDAQAQGPCSEAVYVDTLVLHAGARLTLDNCRLFSRYIVDDGALVRTIGCGELLSPSRGIGDLNCDSLIDSFDIDPFIVALTNPGLYALQFPACDYMRADTNRDGLVNTFDIDPFISVLTSGCSGRWVPILLVACRTNGSILAFNGATGQFIRELVPPSSGVYAPNQIVAGPADSFYVASVNTNSVLQFSIRSGQQMMVFTGGGLSGPDGIVSTPDELLVASFSTGSVKSYDAFSGAPLADFVESHAGGLDGASGMQVRSNGNLLVASQRTDQVLEFDPQGTYIGPAVIGGELDLPYALLLDSQGNLLVGSHGTDAVLRYSANGSLLGYLAPPCAGGLNGPGGLAELPDGSVLVASRYTNQILRYTREGTYAGVFASGSGLIQPTGMALIHVCDPDCNGNGILDRWDIALGFSPDADENGVPDECE